MKHCNKCGIDINTSKRQCPLCFNELEGQFDPNAPALYSTQRTTDNIGRKNLSLFRVFAFLTISTLAICAFINFTFTPDIWWVLVVGSSFLYVWVLTQHTILSSRNFFEKALFQLVAALLVVISTSSVAGDSNWFWPYVVPAASMLTTTFMLLFSSVNKKRNEYLLSIFVLSLFLILVSILVIVLKMDTYNVLNSANILYNSLFILGILMFGFKSLKAAISKKLHM